MSFNYKRFSQNSKCGKIVFECGNGKSPLIENSILNYMNFRILPHRGFLGPINTRKIIQE